jgi:hypothetical protein
MAQVDTSVPVIGLAGPSARLTPEAVRDHLVHLRDGAAEVAGPLGLKVPGPVWP